MSQAATKLPLLDRALTNLCVAYQAEFTTDVRVEVRNWLIRSGVIESANCLGPLRLGIIQDTEELRLKTLQQMVEILGQEPFFSTLAKFLFCRQVLSLAGEDGDEFRANLLKFAEQP